MVTGYNNFEDIFSSYLSTYMWAFWSICELFVSTTQCNNFRGWCCFGRIDMFHVFSLANPPPPPWWRDIRENGLSRKCPWDVEKFGASPQVLGLRRILSFSVGFYRDWGIRPRSSMGLYKDLEKFRTLPLYLGSGTKFQTLPLYIDPGT